MKTSANKKKGIGSFFSFINPKSETLLPHSNTFIPENSVLLYSGRQAIKYVINSITNTKNIQTIWLPEYYCMHVTLWLKKTYPNIKTYRVEPLNPDFVVKASQFVNKNDIILINNFWGVSKCLVDKPDGLVVIEDHSHGWLSTTCINSKADYCVASLRKSLPIPLGGIAWKPDGKIINRPKLLPPDRFVSIWDTITEAMTLKHDFESTYEIDKKEKSLELINLAEKQLHINFDLTHLEDSHKKNIESYMNINVLKLKSKNLATLSTMLKHHENCAYMALNPDAFGLILHLQNETVMQQLRLYLINHNIYPSQLWPDNVLRYGYFLNIHIDYRYGGEDMEYIAEKLNAFSI
ncbi:hypothetical protein FEZ18_14270 [Oceanihabitans sp. IOP_32]|uniref:hypothetical protein n=1 Tax=Oceanihabitans sp. IOP_32 TaxID=2529032 RepID=UPI001292E919|nr:hypothetical protein [Oceanihabitans sp. IOP_32]QFZ55886.1 hypothetical protein FEZ18_14270 [Oceanihabitans sp. IOP_32]